MSEDTVPSSKRRFLTSDYDFIAEYVDKEAEDRKNSDFRKSHEALWKEVDRQVRMKPMEVTNNDPDLSWKAALEMGDMSTASEVLSADVLRLMFPQDRRWLSVHSNIDFKRLQHRTDKEITEKERDKIQKSADSELRAMMTQQHEDFGFRGRVELSVKEALHHGSFVSEVEWHEIQQYAMGGIFKSIAAPVWLPHSMWNCYPEPLHLGVDLIYTGSMIICSNHSYDWICRQNNFINVGLFKGRTSKTDEKNPIEIKTYFGNITVKRKGKDMYLPNMKVKVANKTVLFAQPMNNVSIIYGGYDRVDLRDPYYMSPLVKQSTNHRIVTTIANKFLDNVELKLEPPTVYDGNDPVLVAQGGPKMIPGSNTPTKGGTQNFKQIDVGDPSWAAEAIQAFKADIKEGTGVSSSRAGAQRQADRVTATQIEEEAAGSNVRTIDFIGKIEKGIKSYCYIQHEMNFNQMKVYKFYNPDMGMPDFGELRGKDLPREAHFEMVGSKGVLAERRRAQQTTEVMAFLMSNDRTADLPNIEEMAKQMLLDAGNRNPEQLLNLSEGNSEISKRVEAMRVKMEEMINELRGKLQEVTQQLINKEMELKLSNDRLLLRNERAEGTENSLREEIRALNQQIDRSNQLMQKLGEIQDETQRQETIKKEIERNNEVNQARKEGEGNSQGKEKQSAPVTTIVKIEKAGGHKVIRNKSTGDMTGVIAVDDLSEIEGA